MDPRFQLVILLAGISFVLALPEPGIWEDVEFPQDKGYLYFTKSLYKGTVLSLKIDCSSKMQPETVRIGWLLRYSPCATEYQTLEGNAKENLMLDTYFNKPNGQLYKDFNYDKVEYMQHLDIMKLCNGHIIYLPDDRNIKPYITKAIDPSAGGRAEPVDKEKDDKENDKSGQKDVAANKSDADKNNKTEKKEPGKERRRREATKSTSSQPGAGMANATTAVMTDTIPVTSKALIIANSEKVDNYDFAKVWRSGYFILILKIDSDQADGFQAKVTVSMKGSVGYISAVEWPLLIFYGVMGLVYIVYGLIWLVMLACNWRDLLRVQYWVGGVIVLGMLEKAVFYAEYQSIASTGQSVTEGAVIFAEVVSCLKRALARMLVIIVSLGFGIVKPRLGPTFHKVLFVGGLYFVLATIEGCMRSLKPKGDQSTDLMLSAVPLAIVDASICWWIFSSLVQTTRQLRLRRNVVKLTLYRHFTNTLIFAILASIIFMIWSIVQMKMKLCIKDWQEIWIDEAFWHLLFSVILAVIMLLWRPSSNNQRYAFSPLLDAADDEDEDETPMNDAFDGMKMRTKQVNGSPKQKQNTIEDDLKWVEENIPSAISDKAQTLLDSDEEIMTAKYEMSKMQ